MEGVQSGLVDKKLIKLPFKEATENPGNLVISRLSGFFHLVREAGLEFYLQPIGSLCHLCFRKEKHSDTNGLMTFLLVATCCHLSSVEIW